MTTVKALYTGPTSVDFGTGITTLASSATVGQVSNVFDNTSNLYIDASFYAAITMTSGTMANDKAVYVYGMASEDGTHYTGSAANAVDSLTTGAPYVGTAGGFTITSPTSLFGPFTFPIVTNATTGPYYLVIPSIRDLFGGLVLPKKFALVVINFTGLAFTAFTDSVPNAHNGEWTGAQLSNV